MADDSNDGCGCIFILIVLVLIWNGVIKIKGCNDTPPTDTPTEKSAPKDAPPSDLVPIQVEEPTK